MLGMSLGICSHKHGTMASADQSLSWNKSVQSNPIRLNLQGHDSSYNSHKLGPHTVYLLYGMHALHNVVGIIFAVPGF